MSAYRRNASLNEALAFAPRAVNPAAWPFRDHPTLGELMRADAADQAERDAMIERRLARMERCDG